MRNRVGTMAINDVVARLHSYVGGLESANERQREAMSCDESW